VKAAMVDGNGGAGKAHAAGGKKKPAKATKKRR
jgi:hypothetical protein